MGVHIKICMSTFIDQDMVNVVILLAFKALLMDFPNNGRKNTDKKTHTF